nr:AlpA family phage regulatory protein [Bradyrhizobium sp. WSM1743]
MRSTEIVRKHKFPKRVPVAGNRVGWVADEIDDRVDAAIARRSHASGRD